MDLDARWLILALFAWGFWNHRKWLKEYFIDWWGQMKAVLRGGKDE